MTDKSHLKNAIIHTEMQYSSEFSQVEKTELGIRFTDSILPDMHSHNFIRIERDKIAQLCEIIEVENLLGKAAQQEAVQVEVFDCLIEDVQQLVKEEYLREQIVLYCEIEDLVTSSKNRDFNVHIAETSSDLEKGKIIDRLSFGHEYEDFSDKRFDRKLSVYKNRESKMNHFICYNEEDLLGNCDFFIFEKLGKIEDFDVLKKHQRKGYGSAIIGAIKEYALSQGVEVLFLQVESDNSAIEMYNKLGFKPLFNNIIYNRKVK